VASVVTPKNDLMDLSINDLGNSWYEVSEVYMTDVIVTSSVVGTPQGSGSSSNRLVPGDPSAWSRLSNGSVWVKTFFQLPDQAFGGAYEGLKVRRLDQVGRLVLYQIINDPPPYWMIWIKAFKPRRDTAPGLIHPDKIPVWRFTDIEKARAKFTALASLPIFVAEAEKVAKSRESAKQRILSAGTPFPKRSGKEDGPK
jgi:hypothetical protein